jgi:hypothetical protein
VARLPDADKHPCVQNRHEHQPVAEGQPFETEKTTGQLLWTLSSVSCARKGHLTA